MGARKLRDVTAWLLLWVGMFAFFGVLFQLKGCAHPQTVEVQVPVAVKAEPPPELREPLDFSRLPTFVPPDDPKATSALTDEGERSLKRLLLDLLMRVRAWEAWGKAEAKNEP